MTMPYPAWITKLPNGPQKLRKMNRFRLRLAALYAHPDGSLCQLSRLINVNYDTLKSQTISDRCLSSPATKDGIRRILGTEFVPPDRPDDWQNLC